MSEKNLEYYLSLPYTIEVIPDRDEDGEFYLFARVVELLGCMTQADDFTELGEMIEDAKAAWLESALEDGQSIPEPRPLDDYSGKFVVRVPKLLHRDLVDMADKEGVSLNAYVSVALGRAVGSVEAAPNSESDCENIPAPAWPQLSQAAWRAMVAAGLELEAQAINEEMFANWLDNHVMQLEAALEMGTVGDAEYHLAECIQALRICSVSSQIMGVFNRTVKLLQIQMAEIIELRRGSGMVQRSAFKYQLREQVRSSSYQVNQAIRQQKQPGILPGIDLPGQDFYNELAMAKRYEQNYEQYE